MDGMEAVRAAAQRLGSVVTDLRPVAGGSGRATWQVTTPDGLLAVRVFPASHLGTARGMARLMGHLTAANFPVPRVVGLVEEPRHVFLMQEWRPGLTCAEALTREPERAHEIGAAFGGAQARLHALPVPPEAEGAAPTLELDRAPSRRRAWLHLDYHPLNVLVEGGEVRAVLDWENARLGDPRADVARTLSILSIDPELWRAGREVRRTLRAFRQGYLVGYGEEGIFAGDGAAFLAWAGDFMREDLRSRFGEAELGHLARWSRSWRSRGAG